MSEPTTSRLDRLFAPVWAGPWTAFRLAFAVSATAALLPRYAGIGDAYGVQDMVFSQRPFRLAEKIVFTEPTMTVIWAAGLAGLVLLAIGGRLAKPGVVIWLVCSWLMIASEALNIKAYDRLLTWMAIAMLLGPSGERNMAEKWRSPVGRWFLVLVFCAIYGSTGWLKALKEPAWWSGEVLSYHLVHQYFGLKPLGIWVSAQQWITAPFGTITVLFECAFPLLIWFRRTNPWMVAIGCGMHLGILLLMNVGPFSYVALAAYPVLLHPEFARRWWARFEERRSCRSTR